MISLDTHALLWWTLAPEQLSKKAQKLCSTIETNGCTISSICLWEIAIKIKNGTLDIGLDIKNYTDKLKELEYVTIVPVDENIWIESVKLNWSHRDPADRVIVATAKRLSLPLITKDKQILSFYKKAVW